MREEIELKELIRRYKENRAKVPLKTLKTKYAAPYKALKENIWEQALRIAYRPPDWMWSVAPPAMTWELMTALFRKTLSEAGAKKLLRDAMFKSMDAGLAITYAREINKDLIRAWEMYLDNTSKYMCWVTDPNDIPQPVMYSPFLLSIKKEDGWQRIGNRVLVPDFSELVNSEIGRFREWMPKEGR